ncbi:hypothetical protein B296_00056372 [Ensete ventricosum]|uniref:Uncharacterized protein n=1 Tax=Ensete ventricosum TaxID=4639 RepID=A0A426X978_ENSVE|nr:hypothetical protein B296_00056372 [Ensete ventricosum]
MLVSLQVYRSSQWLEAASPGSSFCGPFLCFVSFYFFCCRGPSPLLWSKGG